MKKTLFLTLIGLLFCTKLVAQNENTNVQKIGETYWSKKNAGASNAKSPGLKLSYQDAVNRAPKGYRLPTEAEVWELIMSGDARFGTSEDGPDYAITSGKKIIIPFTRSSGNYNNWSGYGEYWIQGGMMLYFSMSRSVYYGKVDIDKTQPEIREGYSSAYVRYVLDN